MSYGGIEVVVAMEQHRDWVTHMGSATVPHMEVEQVELVEVVVLAKEHQRGRIQLSAHTVISQSEKHCTVSLRHKWDNMPLPLEAEYHMNYTA